MEKGQTSCIKSPKANLVLKPKRNYPKSSDKNPLDLMFATPRPDEKKLLARSIAFFKDPTDFTPIHIKGSPYHTVVPMRKQLDLLHTKRHIASSITVLDVKVVGMSNFTKSARNLFMELQKIVNNYYPGFSDLDKQDKSGLNWKSVLILKSELKISELKLSELKISEDIYQKIISGLKKTFR
ncbi:hypothetical protein AgCh_028549 [Apium graveolens]